MGVKHSIFHLRLTEIDFSDCLRVKLCKLDVNDKVEQDHIANQHFNVFI